MCCPRLLLLLATACLQVKALRSSQSSSSAWAEGCKLVYLDIGSNVGVQIRKLFEPDKYPDASILSYFDGYFGKPEVRSRPFKETGLCAIGFEANPRFVPRLKEIEDAYNAMGWRVHFIAPRIVSDVDNDTVTFYTDQDENVNQWGSSVIPWQGEGMQEVTVPTLDLASFLDREVFPAHPNVIAKMDIEGSEFIVVPRMLELGQLCNGRLMHINIEWHPKMMPEGAQGKDELMKNIDGQTCKNGTTTLTPMDDESYLLDGMPLPGRDTEPKSVPQGVPKSSESVPQEVLETKTLYRAAQVKWAKRRGRVGPPEYQQQVAAVHSAMQSTGFKYVMSDS